MRNRYVMFSSQLLMEVCSQVHYIRMKCATTSKMYHYVLANAV